MSVSDSVYDGDLVGRVGGEIGRLSVYLCVPLIFLPKVNLFSVGGENAGLRIDDLFIAIALGLIFASFILLRRSFLSLPEAMLFPFLFLGLLSNVLAGGTPLYVFRVLEYFAFFYVGLNAAKLLNLRTILIAFIAWNATLIPLQYAHILGGFYLGNYEYGQALGIGSGTWEIGLLLNVAWATLAFGHLCSRWTVVLLGTIVFILHFMVGSRAPAATFLLLFVIYSVTLVKRNAGVVLLALPAIGATGIVIFDVISSAAQSSRLVSRLSTLSTTQYFDLANRLWHMTPARSEFVGYEEAHNLAQRFADSDLSLLERAQKAIGALKYYLQSSPLLWIIGTGPGRYGPAVDMGWVRILAETGVAGTGAFLLCLYSSLKQVGAVWALLFIFALSMLTLDTYLSYKVMCLLFFIGGMSFEAQETLQNDRALAAA